jgi:hypothetical protein
MRSRGRISIVAFALAATAVLGCGTIVAEQEAQDTIHTELEHSLNVPIENVNCPPGLDVEPMATFRCDVDTSDGPFVVTVTILNDDADLEIKALSRA